MPGVSGCWLLGSCRLRRFSFIEPLWWRFMRSICSSTLIFTFVSLANTALFGLSWGEPSPRVTHPCLQQGPALSAHSCIPLQRAVVFSLFPGCGKGTETAQGVPRSWMLRCGAMQQ